MSKSKGNIIDPLEIIAEYGADAMRMTLASSTTEAPQIDLDVRRFEEFRNFANKIWNSARFVFLNLEANETGPSLSHESFSKGLDLSLLSLEDHWILAKLSQATQEINSHLAAYAFDKAISSIYKFYWDEFCAYYLEINKPVLFGKTGSVALRENKQKLLVILLLRAVRLLHPIAPFITEELFQLLKTRFEGISHNSQADTYTQEAINALKLPACIVSNYPEETHDLFRKESLEEFDLLSRIVYAIRNIRGEMKIPLGSSTDVYIVGDSFALIEKHQYIISSLVKIKALFLQKEPPKGGSNSSAVVDSLQLFVSLPQEMMEQERSRLIKEQQKLQQAILSLDTRLSNTAFIEKAPPKVVQDLIKTKEMSEKQLETLQIQLTTLI